MKLFARASVEIHEQFHWYSQEETFFGDFPENLGIAVALTISVEQVVSCAQFLQYGS